MDDETRDSVIGIFLVCPILGLCVWALIYFSVY